MLSVVMLNGIMPGVVAPIRHPRQRCNAQIIY